MKIMKLILTFICVALGMFGILYRLVVWPFSSPMFDLISWIAIGLAFLIMAIIARTK